MRQAKEVGLQDMHRALGDDQDPPKVVLLQPALTCRPACVDVLPGNDSEHVHKTITHFTPFSKCVVNPKDTQVLLLLVLILHTSPSFACAHIRRPQICISRRLCRLGTCGVSSPHGDTLQEQACRVQLRTRYGGGCARTVFCFLISFFSGLVGRFLFPAGGTRAAAPVGGSGLVVTAAVAGIVVLVVIPFVSGCCGGGGVGAGTLAAMAAAPGSIALLTHVTHLVQHAVHQLAILRWLLTVLLVDLQPRLPFCYHEISHLVHGSLRRPSQSVDRLPGCLPRGILVPRSTANRDGGLLTFSLFALPLVSALASSGSAAGKQLGVQAMGHVIRAGGTRRVHTPGSRAVIVTVGGPALDTVTSRRVLRHSVLQVDIMTTTCTWDNLRIHNKSWKFTFRGVGGLSRTTDIFRNVHCLRTRREKVGPA